MILNDAQIRPFLTDFLSSKMRKPKKIIEELPVSYGDAIADIVIAEKYLHCYEIKGETDTVQRIQKQGIYYNFSFRKITLVTTENHLSYARDKAPDFWGIILAKQNGDKTVFKCVRGAKDNPNFSKEEALHTLWKSELLSISKRKNIDVKETMNKRTISKVLADNLSDDFVAACISNSVQART